jgi:hypothetical protein
MKMYTFKKIQYMVAAVAGAIIIVLSACKKENTGTPNNPPGNLKVDAVKPDSASGGTALTLTGSGLGSITSIKFDNGNIPANFNPVFNNEHAIVFRIPDTANGGKQHIILTNSAGKSVAVPFKVIALPTVSAVSDYNYSGSSPITLTGNNLQDVKTVRLIGTADQGTIISQTKKQLVITLPSSITRSQLILTNSSGTDTTSQEFVNLDKTYQIFTDDYGSGIQNGSWGPADISTTVFKTGTASFAATFPKGNWSADGFANWNSGIPYMSDYKYLSFWVKGGSEDYTVYLVGGGRPAGFGNGDTGVPLSVPKNVWTYFKLRIDDINLWANKQPFNQIGWFIQGPNDQSETLYFDDVVLIK